jgi:hypothetical protein
MQTSRLLVSKFIEAFTIQKHLQREFTKMKCNVSLECKLKMLKFNPGKELSHNQKMKNKKSKVETKK